MAKSIHKSILVHGDVASLYRIWANFENFPHFMKHIKHIRRTGDRLSHWEMASPLGRNLEWDAQTTAMEENIRIAWQSTGGDIETGGEVRFEQQSDDQAKVTVSMHYTPPEGLTFEIAQWLLREPEDRLMEDLKNFKKYAESKAQAPRKAA